ncbi:hypothetical protein CLAIMM_11788 [Cladophialophora immunda]|nr:hypothetical protein CLAIMM_11788 [Cladophialophora immunda]
MGECCLRGFRWDAQPKGRDTMLAGRHCYVTGSESQHQIGIMIIHDVFGWTFTNTRVLADHYAEEIGATVYVPDFFGGDVLPADVILAGPEHWGVLDFPTFFGSKNAKHVRGPEMVECAKLLRARYKRLGAVGYCFGGWGVFQLGSTANNGLVDCISTAHPSFLVEEEIRGLGVPVQICAPENDAMFLDDLKALCNQVIPTLGIPYDYQHFPGLDHGFAIRGDLGAASGSMSVELELFR